MANTIATNNTPVLIQAVAVTREDAEDGLRLEWLLEGGISEMEFAGMTLFALPEANDLCEADGSAYVYLRPPTEQVEVVAPGWRPMSTAPRDGTMLRLLVEFTEHATEDEGTAPTIGANNFDHDDQDEWKFAGWCWEHDHFTEGKGKPVGWLPMFEPSTEGLLGGEGADDGVQVMTLHADAFDRFSDALDANPMNQNKALQDLMARPKPWATPKVTPLSAEESRGELARLRIALATKEQAPFFDYLYRHPDSKHEIVVTITSADVLEHMDEVLFEKLTCELCHCEPVGETNVVDCRCNEVAEQFELVKDGAR